MHHLKEEPRLVAWEATAACNLACVHCRAEAQTEPDPDELTTAEVKRLIDQIAEFASPIFIITGGEPMLREDVYEIAAYASERGLKPVMSPNGTLLTPETVQKIKEAGVSRISVSLDGSSAEKNDSFRMVPGAFDAAVRGLEHARRGGLPFQINTTVTRRNLDDLEAMFRTVVDLGAVGWDVFMLVPTGRGKIEDEVAPEEYERVLNWIYDLSKEAPIPVKVTCGPHYQRISRLRDKEERLVGPPGHPAGGARRRSPGCMGGRGFCFVSRVGEVYPCGYLPVSAGNVRETHFREIYQGSELFRELRDVDRLKGKCGRCEFRRVCSGCRARAYGAYGDYMAEEPYCTYEPRV